MSRLEATEEYLKALKLGQKEVREYHAKGKPTNPAVLHQIVGELAADSSVRVGLVEIPMNRIVGTKTAGRISAFSPTFLPLLGRESEFSAKWIDLCAAHLNEGIRDPIVCYEYYGNFYVQEGNKRVSVLRYFECPRVSAVVHRVMPAPSEEPRYRAYLEFLEFYRNSGMYDVQFTAPGCYDRLCQAVGIPSDRQWAQDEVRRFRAWFQYFQDAYEALGGDGDIISPEHALLIWLEVYNYADLGKFTTAELKESLQKTWDNIQVRKNRAPAVKTDPPSGAIKATKLLTKLIGGDHLNVAFIHHRTAAASPWTRAHEAGRMYLEDTLGKNVTCRSYFGADTPELGEAILMDALRDGAEVIFTTTPLLVAPSLKISVKFPNVRILNCSLHMPYSTIRTYYSRVYEGKYITGAIAGAMTKNDRIGYVGTYPIHGEPAAINAFALGAQLTNPRAKIELKWSCLPGNPTKELLGSGVRVISNRDTPDADRIYTDYGTYYYNEAGKAIPMGSPVWKWGHFYAQVIRSIQDGTFDRDQEDHAVNYWWGIKSGVIDVALAPQLPEGLRFLAEMLRGGLRSGQLDPFKRRIVSQDGVVRSDGSQAFSPEELLRMDWLCENVVGHIPTLEEVIPESRAMVQLLGVFQEDMP